MSIRSHWLSVALAAASLVGVTGCSKKADNNTEKTPSVATSVDKSSLAEAAKLWEYIPADSPYVLTGWNSDRALRDLLINTLGPGYKKIVQSIASMIVDDLNNLDDEERAFAEMFATELRALSDPNELLKIFGENFSSTLYGLGLLPVLNVKLANAASVRAILDRFYDKLPQEKKSLLLKQKLGTQDYLSLTVDDISVALAVTDNSLIVTFSPKNIAEKIFGYAFLQKKPEVSLTASGKMNRLIKDYNAKDGVGFIDIVEIVSTIFNLSTGLNKEVGTSLDLVVNTDKDPDEAVCAKEYLSIASQFPRLVIAVSTSPKQVDSTFALELPADVAQELSKLSVKLPGIKGENDFLFSGSFGLDLNASINFLRGVATKINSSPYQCRELRGLNELAKEGLEQLKPEIVPPFLAGPFGVQFAVSNLPSMNVLLGGSVPNKAPEETRAILGFLVKEPQALVSFAKVMLSEELGSLNLEPNGKAVALPSILAGDSSVSVSLTNESIAVAFGSGEEANMNRIGAGDATSSVFRMKSRHDLFSNIFESSMAQFNRNLESLILENNGDLTFVELLEGLKSTMDAWAKLIGFSVQNVTFEKQGVMWHSSIEFK